MTSQKPKRLEASSADTVREDLIVRPLNSYSLYVKNICEGQ